jgi:hypothetical protein
MPRLHVSDWLTNPSSGLLYKTNNKERQWHFFSIEPQHSGMCSLRSVMGYMKHRGQFRAQYPVYLLYAHHTQFVVWLLLLCLLLSHIATVIRPLGSEIIGRSTDHEQEGGEKFSLFGTLISKTLPLPINQQSNYSCVYLNSYNLG